MSLGMGDVRGVCVCVCVIVGMKATATCIDHDRSVRRGNQTIMSVCRLPDLCARRARSSVCLIQLTFWRFSGGFSFVFSTAAGLKWYANNFQERIALRRVNHTSCVCVSEDKHLSCVCGAVLHRSCHFHFPSSLHFLLILQASFVHLITRRWVRRGKDPGILCWEKMCR